MAIASKTCALIRFVTIAVCLSSLQPPFCMSGEIQAFRIDGGKWSDTRDWAYDPSQTPKPIYPRSGAVDRFFVDLGDYPVTIDQTVGEGAVSVSELNIGTGGRLTITDGKDLIMQDSASLTNGRLLEIDSDKSFLFIAEGEVTLSGGGTIEITDPGAGIAGAAGIPRRLINEDNSIVGVGSVGSTSTAITNRGIIAATVSEKKLRIDPGGGTREQPDSIINDRGGQLLATGGGILELAGGVFENKGGVIRAEDGSIVELGQAADIRFGELEANGNGLFRTSGNAALTDIKLKAPVEIQDQTLTLRGTILNESEMTLAPDERVTFLMVDDIAGLAGSGLLTMTDPALSVIRGTNREKELIHGASHTIAGTGSLGSASLHILNNGTVSANMFGLPIILEPTRGSTTVNNNVLEARNGGVLNLLNATIDNQNGTIRAVDDGFVDLINTTVRGGTLTNVDESGAPSFTSTIRLFGNGNVFDGSASKLTSDAIVDMNGNTLTLKGMIENSNTFRANGSTLFIDGPVTLQGGGTIDSSKNILAANPTASLTNVNNTIEAGWNIVLPELINGTNGKLISNSRASLGSADSGDDVMMVANAGLIAAVNSQLAITNVDLVNSGTLLAMHDPSSLGFPGRILVDSSSVTGGSIEAQAGSSIAFDDATIVDSTTLGNVFVFRSTLDNVTNNGVIVSGFGTKLKRTLANNGEVTMEFAFFSASLVVDGSDVSLSGGGVVRLVQPTGPSAHSSIDAAGLFSHLANQDNTIEGDGTINVSLTNESAGVVVAGIQGKDSTGQTLSLDTNAKTNNGLMLVQPGATMAVNVDVTGSGQWIVNGGKLHLSEGVDVSTTGPITLINGAELEMRNARIDASRILTDGTAIFDIMSNVSVTESFRFGGTEEANWSWAAEADLEMLGGVGATNDDWAGWGQLEVAGTNQGVGVEGFDNNFAIPELIIGPSARVTLVDRIDNGNRGGPAGSSEAIYVDRLTFADDSAILNLNNLNVVFNTLIGNPNQIIDVPVDDLPGSLGLAGDGQIYTQDFNSLKQVGDPLPAGMTLSRDGLTKSKLQSVTGEGMDFQLGIPEHSSVNLEIQIVDSAAPAARIRAQVSSSSSAFDLSVIARGMLDRPVEIGGLRGSAGTFSFDSGVIDLDWEVNSFNQLSFTAEQGDLTLDDLAIIIPLPGDIDADGEVGFADFVTLSTNYGGPGAWSQGDFDRDGQVGFADFVRLSTSFGKTAELVTVPEPSWLRVTLMCVLLACRCNTVRRGCRKSRFSWF